MENFIKSFLISLLASGSFVSHAMQDEELEKGMAASFNVTLEAYREARETAAFLNVPIEQCLPALPSEKEFFKEQRIQQKEDRHQKQEEAQNEQLFHEMLAREEQEEQMVLDMLAQEEQSKQENAAALLIRQYQPQARSFIGQVNDKSAQFASGEKRPLLKNFMRIFGDLKAVTQHSDVHVLDNYVFGTGNNIRYLIEIGDLYQIDNPNLTLAQTGQQMIQFMNDYVDLFKDYNYLGESKTPQQITAIFNNYFSSMGTQVAQLCPAAAQEVWSRAWTLALNLYNQNKDADAIKIIFDQVVEGPLTRGGCPQGLINRGFVGYVILLGKAGVGIHKG